VKLKAEYSPQEEQKNVDASSKARDEKNSNQSSAKNFNSVAITKQTVVKQALDAKNFGKDFDLLKLKEFI
jgi:hypothetical protein